MHTHSHSPLKHELPVPVHRSLSKQPWYLVQAIRPLDCQILMGKNTLMKRCIRLYCENKGDDAWGALLPELVGNVGLLFVRDDFGAIKDIVEQFRQPAAARANAIAQCNVDIAAGPTSLDPSQTSFFQALGISTKIQKGAPPTSHHRTAPGNDHMCCVMPVPSRTNRSRTALAAGSCCRWLSLVYAYRCDGHYGWGFAS